MAVKIVPGGLKIAEEQFEIHYRRGLIIHKLKFNFNSSEIQIELKSL